MNNETNSSSYSDYDNQQTKNESAFECNICLDTAKDAVVSMCGHLFCWPCLYQWMYTTDGNTQSHNTCPVCKSAISREKTIPIYGRCGDSETNRQDPRDKLPPRPSGQRTEIPNPQNQFPYGNWAMGGPGAHMFHIGDGGFGLMSFGFATWHQNVFALLNQVLTNNDRMANTEYYYMRSFTICGILLILLTLYFA